MRLEIFPEYEFQIITNFKTQQALETCKEWSPHTNAEEHMVYRSPEWMVNNLIFAIAIFHDNKFIGAAGLKYVYKGKKIISIWSWRRFKRIKVVELCSNYVDPEYREQHLGEELARMRALYAREKSFLPVVVTKSLGIISIIERIGFVKIKNTRYPYKTLSGKIRDCSCQNEGGNKVFTGERCKVCPVNGGKTIYVLLPYTKLLFAFSSKMLKELVSS